MAKLNDQDPYARALAYLVIRSLLAKLPAEQQLDVGLDALKLMSLESADNMSDFMKGTEHVQEVVDDLSLATAVFHKPSSRHTRHRLQAAILVMLPNIRRPVDLTVNWLSNEVVRTYRRSFNEKPLS